MMEEDDEPPVAEERRRIPAPRPAPYERPPPKAKPVGRGPSPDNRRIPKPIPVRRQRSPPPPPAPVNVAGRWPPEPVYRRFDAMGPKPKPKPKPVIPRRESPEPVDQLVLQERAYRVHDAWGPKPKAKPMAARRVSPDRAAQRHGSPPPPVRRVSPDRGGPPAVVKRAAEREVPHPRLRLLPDRGGPVGGAPLAAKRAAVLLRDDSPPPPPPPAALTTAMKDMFKQIRDRITKYVPESGEWNITTEEKDETLNILDHIQNDPKHEAPPDEGYALNGFNEIMQALIRRGQNQITKLESRMLSLTDEERTKLNLLQNEHKKLHLMVEFPTQLSIKQFSTGCKFFATFSHERRIEWTEAYELNSALFMALPYAMWGRVKACMISATGGGFGTCPLSTSLDDPTKLSDMQLVQQALTSMQRQFGMTYQAINHIMTNGFHQAKADTRGVARRA